VGERVDIHTFSGSARFTIYADPRDGGIPESYSNGCISPWFSFALFCAELQVVIRRRILWTSIFDRRHHSGTISYTGNNVKGIFVSMRKARNSVQEEIKRPTTSTRSKVYESIFPLPAKQSLPLEDVSMHQDHLIGSADIGLMRDA
jgi:hypothetical protein